MKPLTNVEVFLGRAPLLEVKLTGGLIQFGRAHPQWRFSLRGADFRYTPEWLKRHGVSGVLVLIDAEPVQRALSLAKIPWVHLLPSDDVTHPAVNVDDRAIGRLGAEKFLDLGFTQFAFCGVGTHWSHVREQGFRDRLQERGFTHDRFELSFERLEHWTLSSQAEERLTGWLKKQKKRTAIMAVHDVVASNLIEVCLRNGIHVPDEIAILGVGNHELVCELCPVPISSIDCAVPEVAIRGGELLEALIHKKADKKLVLVSPQRLVERRSTDVLVYQDVLIRRIVEYIHDHVCDGLTVEHLVEMFHLSRRTLSRRFEAHVGRTPGAEIRLARLLHAKRMLVETKMSLTEIAMTCGFSDLSHMDRAFRNVLDTTPGAIRNR